MSKYKLILGKDLTPKWWDVGINARATFGQLMAANDKYLALSYFGEHAQFVILDKKTPQRLYKVTSHVCHIQNLNDIRFSPFFPNILSTASDDGTIKLWKIEENSTSEELKNEVQKLNEHSKRVVLFKYHPCSSEVAASASNDKTVKVWDITCGKSLATISTPETVSSLDWTIDGKLIGVMCTNKIAHILDPRANKEVISTTCHASAKCQKMLFVSPTNYVSFGFSSEGREIKLFDIAKPEQAVNTIAYDKLLGVPYPHYDYDTNIIYIPAKGENTVPFYSFTDGNISYLHNPHKMKMTPECFCFEDKRCVDLTTNEIGKLYRYCKGVMEMTTFYIPRKEGGTDKSLYPETFSGESALTADEWIKGADKEQIRKNIEEIKFENLYAKSEMFKKSE